MRTAVEFAISYANAPSCGILFSLAPDMNAGATCDRSINLRSQVQHSDFSSSINDFCDHYENFLKKNSQTASFGAERCMMQSRRATPGRLVRL
jgi:hypothetical protein